MPASVWSYSYSACCWNPVAPPPGAADLLFARFGWSWLCVVTFRSKSVSAEVFRRTNHLPAPSQPSHQQHKITGREEQEENHKQPSVCRVVQQCKPSERQVSTAQFSEVNVTSLLLYSYAMLFCLCLSERLNRVVLPVLERNQGNLHCPNRAKLHAMKRYSRILIQRAREGVEKTKDVEKDLHSNETTTTTQAYQ